MQLSLYLDENRSDGRLRRALRKAGIDVVTAFELGMIGRSDDDHLERAASLGRVVYTADAKDFFRIHTEYMNLGRHHAGIAIAAHRGVSPERQAQQIVRLAARLSADDMRDRLEFLGDSPAQE